GQSRRPGHAAHPSGRRAAAAAGGAGVPVARHPRRGCGACGAAHPHFPPRAAEPHRLQRPPHPAGPGAHRQPGGRRLFLHRMRRPGGDGGAGAGFGGAAGAGLHRRRPRRRRAGAEPHAPDGDGRGPSERAAAGQSQSAVVGQAGAAGGGVHVPARGHGDADAQQVRENRVQRGHRAHRRRGPGGGGAVGDVPEAGRTADGAVRSERAGRAGAGVLHHGAQEPGQRIPGGHLAPDDAALRDAAAEFAVYGGDAGEAARGAGGQPPGAADGAGRHQRRTADKPVGGALAPRGGGGWMKKQGRTVDGGGRRRAARRALFLGAWCVLIWLGASALLGGTARPGVASAQALPPDAVVEKAPAAMADGVTAARVDERAAMGDEAALAFSAQSPAAGSGVQFGLHVGDTPEAFAWQAPLAIRLGADVVALEFRWDVVEPQASRFAWAAFDEAVAAARAAGARIVGVLHYPAHLPPLSRSLRIGWPSAHADDWDFFVQRVVARYGADIEDWIVVRGRAGARDPVLAAADAEYDAQLAQVTAQAVRAAGGRRVFAAAPGADLLWLAVFAARGGLAAVDGLALDVNRWPAAPEGLALVIDDVQQLAAQMGLAPELWVWGFGYPTH